MNENAKEPINAIFSNDEIAYMGLTKREYFAAMAMQGLLSNVTISNMSSSPSTGLNDHVKVEYAIRMADELLKQLEK